MGFWCWLCTMWKHGTLFSSSVCSFFSFWWWLSTLWWQWDSGFTKRLLVVTWGSAVGNRLLLRWLIKLCWHGILVLASLCSSDYSSPFLYNLEFLITIFKKNFQFNRVFLGFWCLIFTSCFRFCHDCASPNDWISTFSEPYLHICALHSRDHYVR